MRPTNTRGIVVVFAITLAVLQYIDRVAISQAAPLVMKDLALTKEQMSWVFSAFTLAYALFEIPGGYLGDWIGPRKVLLRIVLWWSFFTAATGWAWGLASLMITLAWWYRDDPRTHLGVNAAEAAILPPVPLGAAKRTLSGMPAREAYVGSVICRHGGIRSGFDPCAS
jgi:MFS family permease